MIAYEGNDAALEQPEQRRHDIERHEPAGRQEQDERDALQQRAQQQHSQAPMRSIQPTRAG
jgi:hypothetical protein